MAKHSEYPGWVSTESANDLTLFDPSRISNVRLISVDFNGERCVQRYEFDYERADGAEDTHIAIVPAQRRESFQDEVNRALRERESPDWVDPRMRMAG